MRKASPEDAEKLFLRLMIPHHQAAVPMAEAAIEETDRPEVRQLAGAIAATQKYEIEAMQDMLEEREAKLEGGDSPEGHAGHH